VAGLLLLAWIQVRAWWGAYTPHRHLGVQMAAIYWHFVVVLQLAIFAALYLSPRL
jgi:cytochrome c oxidase subunit 3